VGQRPFTGEFLPDFFLRRARRRESDQNSECTDNRPSVWLA